MIGIIDYGVGNLFSLSQSLKSLGIDAGICADKDKLASFDKLILPGVGAFGDAKKKLVESGMQDGLFSFLQSGRAVLGICLGMQLLFDKSFEYGEHEGLKLIGGEVVPLEKSIDLKIPHMGWNSLKFKRESRLFKYVDENEFVYFVHSFHAINCEKDLVATCDYQIEVTAAVERGNIFGTQFHPEKSGDTGMRILKAFGEL